MRKKIKQFLKPYKIIGEKFIAYFIRKINNKVKNPNFKCNADTVRCVNNIKSLNYKYEYFGENIPVCCVTNLYKILKDVINILEKNNLEYFISFGEY